MSMPTIGRGKIGIKFLGNDVHTPIRRGRIIQRDPHGEYRGTVLLIVIVIVIIITIQRVDGRIITMWQTKGGSQASVVVSLVVFALFAFRCFCFLFFRYCGIHIGHRILPTPKFSIPRKGGFARGLEGPSKRRTGIQDTQRLIVFVDSQQQSRHFGPNVGGHEVPKGLMHETKHGRIALVFNMMHDRGELFHSLFCGERRCLYHVPVSPQVPNGDSIIFC
mmetsp:Transcript_11116/g.12688  ORF Transcript_11116/g.12688 Transcript_11116/m.12688 type:complete len:220 (+) Transcript_11116:187-846(+)